jgi:F-type H+-transporting ATPase subunit a
MNEHPFTFLGNYLHVTHEWMHVVTGSFVALCLVAMALLLFPKFKRKEESLLPDRNISARSFAEMFMDMLVGLCDEIIGHHGRKYLPFVGTIFFFIFACNLIGLIPGFLPPTENWATGAAIATIVFIAFNYFGIREHGVGYFKHFLAPISLEGLGNKVLYVVILIPLIIFQCLFGTIELISMALRPFTLSIRLFVNITADHAVASIFSGMVPFLVPIPFLVLGLLVSFLQALIFTLLTIVYISLATAHDH